MKDEFERQQEGISSGRLAKFKKRNDSKPVKMGAHAKDNILSRDPATEENILCSLEQGRGEQLVTFEERVEWVKSLVAQSIGYKGDLSKIPNRMGFNLTSKAEAQTLFGVLKIISDKDYKPNRKISPKDSLKSTGDNRFVRSQTEGTTTKGGVEIGGAYRNIPEVPIFKMTPKQILEAADLDPRNQYDKQVVQNAMVDLSTNMHFISWTRLKKDDKGNIVKNKKTGDSKLEIVSTFSPILRVNYVRDEGDNPESPIKYYEVELSPVFLDEMSKEYGGKKGSVGYFLLYDRDFYAEVDREFKRLFPRRTTTTMVLSFCWYIYTKIFTANQQKKQTQRKKSPDTMFECTYSELGQILNITESTLKGQSARIKKKISEAIQVAINLGYLRSFEQDGDRYFFEINPDKYFNLASDQDDLTGTAQVD